MLISHKHKFIFIKTVKTAGTSLEVFLEPLCMPTGHVPAHHTPCLYSEYGIVGARGPSCTQSTNLFYNHMSAYEIRELFPGFDDYFRFSIVRDPYDRAISYCHFRSQQTDCEAALTIDEARSLNSLGDIAEIQRRFYSFLVHNGVPTEKERLCINGKLAVNRLLRYEALISEVESLIEDIGLPLDSATVAKDLPRLKVIRTRTEDSSNKNPFMPIDCYLSKESVILLNESCEWSFSELGYTLKDPNNYTALR